MCPRYSRDKSHIDRFGLARVKQIWIRFDGKTRLTEVEEEEAVRLEERMRDDGSEGEHWDLHGLRGK